MRTETEIRTQIEAFFDPTTATVSYLVWSDASGAAAIIDSVLDYDPVAVRTRTDSADALLAAADARGLSIAWILETHAHADHLSAAAYLKEKTGARVGIGACISDVQSTFASLFAASDVVPDGSAFDQLFADGDTFMIGDLEARVLHTPGHTPACVAYIIGDAVFVGDTLFQPDFGTARCDFPGGDAATLYRSIQKILSLPDDMRVFVGHDYLPKGRTEFAWESTVAEQRAENIHVGGGRSEAAFVKMRTERDATLTPPKLILPSMQINIRAGELPPKQADGRSYMQIPVNTF